MVNTKPKSNFKSTSKATKFKSHSTTLKQSSTGERCSFTQLTRNVYDVERLVGRRSSTRGFMYLVQWKGYGRNGATWELSSTFLQSASDKVIQFADDFDDMYPESKKTIILE